MREVRQQRDIALLAALGMRDEQHLLIKIHIGHLQVHKLGHPRPGLEQSLDEEAPHPRHAIGLGNQALFFSPGEPDNDAVPRGRPGDGQRAPHFFRDVPGLVIREVMPPPEFQGVGDDPVQPIRFRLSGWSTHSDIFSSRVIGKKAGDSPAGEL